MAFIEETITVGDGLRLYLRRHESTEARAEAIIIHGFGDHSGRYGGLTEHLLANRITVTAYDQRGHGLSDGLAGHVDNFSDYDDDLERVIAHTRGRAGRRPLFIIGHSMGGLVALRQLVLKSGTVAGAIISAPLIAVAIPVPAYKLLIARVGVRFAPRLRLDNEINPSHLSRDPEVGRAYTTDPYVTRKVSTRWFAEAVQAMADVKDWASRIRTPVLVMHGTEDKLASIEATKSLFARIGSSDKELAIYEGYYHELFNEPEKKEIFDRVTCWLSQHV